MEAAAATATPALLLDPELVRQELRRLVTALPGVDLLFALKACPHPAVLSVAVEEGVGFDVASPAEVVAALRAGSPPERLSYGHPVASRHARACAEAEGVRDHVIDSVAEARKLAEVAPAARVWVRLSVDQRGADWLLGDKYGVEGNEAADLLQAAAAAGLCPAGVTFHVGSQQREPQRWVDAIRLTAQVLARCDAVGLRVRGVNLGGGWPAQTRAGDDGLEVPAAAALDAARQLLPADVALRAEPGRAAVAAAGVVVATVLGVADRADGRWAYLDTGVYGGLLEADGDGTLYPIGTTATGPEMPTVLAGPTCDSTDVFYRATRPLLPANLYEGDRVVFGGAGAYTATYSTVGFNGHPPLDVRLADLREDVRELPVVRDNRPVVTTAHG